MSENLNDYEVLCSSYLVKRTSTHNWQKKWFVLRRNQLAYYKDSKEYKASKVISIDDILSFNEIPDNHKFHFIIVTSSRIYHLKATDQKTYDLWIKSLGELLNSQSSTKPSLEEDQLPQLVKEPFEFTKPRPIDAAPIDNLNQDLSLLQFSGTDDNFTSDGASRNASSSEINNLPSTPALPQVPTSIPEEDSSSDVAKIPQEQLPNSQELASNLNNTSIYYNSLSSSSPDHIISKGYLFRLRKRYNQWKKYYIILTNHFLFFFKSEQDAEQSKIYKKINVGDILDAVELDSLSRSKLYCMLIITPLKRIRFCAESEEELTKWLVLLKSIVKTRKQEKLAR